MKPSKTQQGHQGQARQGQACPQITYTHGGIDLSYCLLIGGELVDLDAVADQLAHDFALELVQLVLCDGVGLGNDGDDVHLQDRTAQVVSL